jgi:hypothetical protein
MIPKDSPLLRQTLQWTTVVTSSLCAYVRADPAFYTTHCEGVLSAEEEEWLLSRVSPPTAALQVVAAAVARLDRLFSSFFPLFSFLVF